MNKTRKQDTKKKMSLKLDVKDLGRVRGGAGEPVHFGPGAMHFGPGAVHFGPGAA